LRGTRPSLAALLRMRLSAANGRISELVGVVQVINEVSRGDLSRAQRQAYTDAVLCLQSEPSKSGSQVPGARSRFDDFVGTHILQTDWIHGTANFLSWHRYFIFEFEKALKTECGYEGAMPVWPFPLQKDRLDDTNSQVSTGIGIDMPAI
jgi:tyrosinase